MKMIAEWANLVSHPHNIYRISIRGEIVKWSLENLSRIRTGVICTGSVVEADFVFDSGATHTLLSPMLAEQLGIKRGGGKSYARLADGSKITVFECLIGLYCGGEWLSLECRVPTGNLNSCHNLLGLKGLMSDRIITLSKDGVSLGKR